MWWSSASNTIVVSINIEGFAGLGWYFDFLFPLITLDTFQILEHPVRRDGELLLAMLTGNPEVRLLAGGLNLLLVRWDHRYFIDG